MGHRARRERPAALALALRDPFGYVTGRFATDELADPRHVSEPRSSTSRGIDAILAPCLHSDQRRDL